MRRRDAHIFEKDKRGHYVEPAWCSRRLFEVEDFSGPVYDPACGWGTILTEALAVGHEAYGTDIVTRIKHPLRKRFTKCDFLAYNFSAGWEGNIVCNPPFDYVEEFCRKAVELGAAKVAMIMLVRRLNAARWLQELPLRRVWLLTPRPSMPPGSWIAAGNKPGGGTQDFCWVVFERGYVGKVEMNWLHRDRGQDLFKSREAAE